MLILEKSLLDCKIFMTKNSFLPVLSSALCLTLNFLGLFFSRISCVCGLRRVRSFCMCFVNVLGLDCSWFLKINFDVSGLRTPVSWAVSQMKGNSLKSVKFFFTSKLQNHFNFWTDFLCLWLLSTGSVFVGLFVLHGNRNQTSHQTPPGLCCCAGAAPCGTTVWFGLEGTLKMTQFQSSPCGFSLCEPRHGFVLSCCFLCSPVWLRNTQGWCLQCSRLKVNAEVYILFITASSSCGKQKCFDVAGFISKSC